MLVLFPQSKCGATATTQSPPPFTPPLPTKPPTKYTQQKASLFRLYELAALATAASGDDQPRLVELLAALAGEVAPGGEEHVYWARRYRWGWDGRWRCGWSLWRRLWKCSLSSFFSAVSNSIATRSTPRSARARRSVIEDTEGDDGRFDGALRQADQACLAAHVARYGQLGRPLYRRLLQAADAAEAGREDEGDDWEAA